MTHYMILLLAVAQGPGLQQVIYLYLLALDTVCFLTAAFPKKKYQLCETMFSFCRLCHSAVYSILW